MTEESSDTERGYRSMKIEDVLPVKAVGIESLKEANPETMSPHRYLHKWYARRPTAATRLAVLASVLPQSVSNDQLLRWISIGPKNAEHLDQSISDYVIEKRQTQSSRSGSLKDHYGYELPLKSVPNEQELGKLHQTVKSHWDGELPTVLDPTSGGGTIPLEALRYGFPVRANELNPVAWLINKVILEYAPKVGSLEDEFRHWANRIDENAKSDLEQFYPSTVEGAVPTYYFRAYSIECPSCGNRLPLSNRWWFKKDSSTEGHAIKPIPHESHIEYEYHYLSGDKLDEFDPGKGTVSGGDAECLTCGVVTEAEEVKRRFRENKFEIELCGVKYVEEDGNSSGYRAPTEEDRAALEAVDEEINNDLRLSTILNDERYIGRQDRVAPYGILRWKDMFTPRQLLAHTKYLEAFEQAKPKILAEYEQEKAEAILSLLTLTSSKLVSRTSRLTPIHLSYGAPETMMGTNNFAFQWQFGENNPTFGNKSYKKILESRRGVLQSYEQIVGFVEHVEEPNVQLEQGDAAHMAFDDGEAQVAIVDPPYGDNVMYAELSDVFYVWQRLYLNDIFPGQYSEAETRKEEEAVENRALYEADEVEAAGFSSGSEMAEKHYQKKMSEIFSEVYRVLETGGVLTVYFTDKETSAWDSLTRSLINAGFTITSTHTITSEMPQRVSMRERASADTSLLLTCRKPTSDSPRSETPALWDDIKESTREVARKEATRLLDSELNLTKTDTIISAYGPTLRVFTEKYPVVDIHDDPVPPRRALEEARTAVTEILIDRELEDNLETVDSLTKWYILSWLVYERDTIPYDEARQLGLGIGVNIDEIKRDTKIWGKSGDTLILKDHDYRVQDYSALESGQKRRKRAYPIDPRDTTFTHTIDAVHAALNVVETKGSDFTWNWIKERNLQDDTSFRQTIRSLIQVVPENFEDYDTFINLASGETGELLDITPSSLNINREKNKEDRTTLDEF